MPNLKKMTPRQNAQFWYMQEAMRRFEWDMHNKIEQSGRIPKEWHEVAKAPAERVKRQVNIGLEEDVLKFFRSMGKGYGNRINTVLKSFMHARLAGVIEGAETLNHYKEWQEAHDMPKPKFGEMSKAMGEEWEDDAPKSTPYRRKADAMEVMRREFTKRDGEG
jgi:uncharacterized protein (DUF4415 family)